MQLSEIQPQSALNQFDLFDSQQTQESPQLMQTIDQIWKPKAENLSQRYTTD